MDGAHPFLATHSPGGAAPSAGVDGTQAGKRADVDAGSAFPACVTLGKSPLRPEPGVSCLTPGLLPTPPPNPSLCSCQAQPQLAGALEAHL